MPKISLGATDLKRISRDATINLKRVSFGPTLIWQDTPGDILHEYPFDTVLADLASVTEWIDRAYGGTIFPVDANGLYASSTTNRPMNIYYNNIPLANLDQWATVEVKALGADDTEGVGVSLRGTDTTAVLVLFGQTTARIRTGTTNGTGTGTVVNTHTLATPLQVGDVVGAKITGPPEAATVTYLRNGAEIATVTNVATYESYFSGVAINNGSISRVKNFKSGALDATRKRLGLSKSGTLQIATATWQKITAWTLWTATGSIVNDELIIPKRDNYKIEVRVVWDASSGSQLVRVIKQDGTIVAETTSGNSPSTITVLNVVLNEGDSIRVEGYASSSLRRTVQASSYLYITPYGDAPAPVSSTDGVLAASSPTYKSAAQAAGTSRLKFAVLGDSSNDGYGKPGGPDTWEKTWPLRLAAKMRTLLNLPAGGRGWMGPSTPLVPGNYVWLPPTQLPAGAVLDELNFQIGIPGSIWLQKGNGKVDEVTWALKSGVTNVDFFHIGYGGNITITPATGSVVTKDSQTSGVLAITRVPTPGATLNTTPSTGAGWAQVGIVEFIGDETAGVTQYNLSQGSLKMSEISGFLAGGSMQMRQLLATYVPHVVFVNAGSNDFSGGRTVAQCQADMLSTYNSIKTAAPSSEVVFMIRALPTAGWDAYADQLKTYAQSIAKCLDIRAIVPNGLSGAYISDNVHYTEAGNEAIANAVLDYVKVGA